MDTETLLNALCATAKECGKMILQADRTALGILEKSCHRDLVTKYDPMVQELAVTRLSAQFPQAKFLCEEEDAHAETDGDLLFVIDPIDGTANFAWDYHLSCVSIAAASAGEVVAGAVYNPYLDELFSAAKGRGACLNGKPIHVTDRNLEDCLLVFGTSPYDPECTQKTLKLLQSLSPKCSDLRRSGSSALDLCSVAAGRTGMYFEMRISPWDYAAGMLIVREAGGLCLTMEGNPMELVLGRPSILAGTANTIPQSGLI